MNNNILIFKNEVQFRTIKAEDYTPGSVALHYIRAYDNARTFMHDNSNYRDYDGNFHYIQDRNRYVVVEKDGILKWKHEGRSGTWYDDEITGDFKVIKNSIK